MELNLSFSSMRSLPSIRSAGSSAAILLSDTSRPFLRHVSISDRETLPEDFRLQRRQAYGRQVLKGNIRQKNFSNVPCRVPSRNCKPTREPICWSYCNLKSLKELEHVAPTNKVSTALNVEYLALLEEQRLKEEKLRLDEERERQIADMASAARGKAKEEDPGTRVIKIRDEVYAYNPGDHHNRAAAVRQQIHKLRNEEELNARGFFKVQYLGDMVKLSYNQLKSLEDIHYMLNRVCYNKLTYIDLSYNLIETIPERTFDTVNFPGLTTLHLHANALTSVEEMLHCHDLVQLTLQGNLVVGYKMLFVLSLPKLRVLDFEAITPNDRATAVIEKVRAPKSSTPIIRKVQV